MEHGFPPHGCAYVPLLGAMVVAVLLGAVAAAALLGTVAAAAVLDAVVKNVK
jgi:hypothetical protein